MRAPPPPRRSRSRFAALCVVRLRQFLSGHRLKKRWHLHKLHKFERKGLICLSPESGLRAEDMMNIPSALQPKKVRQRPLLIAAFPKGCSRSPRVRVLQRNRLSRLMISKRKYKLKYFDVKGLHKADKSDSVTHRCAQTIGSIKKATSNNADVRVIFHETNVIKCSNLVVSSETGQRSPELFEFAPNQSIRIHDYPSLRKQSILQDHNRQAEVVRKSVAELTMSKGLKTEMIAEVTPTTLQSTTSLDANQRWRSLVEITEFTNSPIISYSRLVRPLPRERGNHPLARLHSLR